MGINNNYMNSQLIIVNLKENWLKFSWNLRKNKNNTKQTVDQTEWKRIKISCIDNFKSIVVIKRCYKICRIHNIPSRYYIKREWIILGYKILNENFWTKPQKTSEHSHISN